MLITRWEEVCYEILVYKSKLSQFKTSTFPWVQFSEKWHVNKGPLRISDIFN